MSKLQSLVKKSQGILGFKNSGKKYFSEVKVTQKFRNLRTIR
jgi:hypothetical protein